MSSPINLSALPIATSVAQDDLMLIRKGLTDYQIAAGIVQAINIGPNFLDPVPGGAAVGSDLMMISRADINGDYQNYNIRFNQVGVVKGTRMWFYNQLPPTGWTIIPGTGGNLLAAQDNQKTYAGNVTAGNVAGTWQQDGVGGGYPGGGLSLNQIPQHTHGMLCSSDNFSGGGTKYYRSGKADHAAGTFQTLSSGGGMPHDHGNLWRPMANVGVIGNKDA